MNLEISLGNVVTGLITGGFAVAAVIISNQLTFRRGYREKLWDLRRTAYGEILSALSQVENVFDIAALYIEENAQRYFEGEGGHYERHQQRVSESMSIARKRFSNDYLVLSQNFIVLFEQMEKRLSAISEDPDLTPDLSHSEFGEAIRKHRAPLLDVARNEILKARAD